MHTKLHIHQHSKPLGLIMRSNNTSQTQRTQSMRNTIAVLGIALVSLFAANTATGATSVAPTETRLSNQALYQQECAACHTAYPPGMLPAESWQRIMGGLQQHYGTDASLDDASVATLTKWLTASAGTYKRVRGAPPNDRITESSWFIRKHDEVAPAIWKDPSVKSAANCAACHTRADRGDFDEDHVRMPQGLSTSLRRYWSNH
jgi:mono/diheme cytochrome c family protein